MSKTNPKCPKTKTDRHDGSCFKATYPGCGIKQHEHGDRSCRYQPGHPKAGQLKCREDQHTHNRRECTQVAGPLCGGS